MKKFLFFFFSIMMLILFTALSCSSGAGVKDDEANSIENAIQTLKDNDIPETNEGMLILRRYKYYLSLLEEGNATLIDWFLQYTTLDDGYTHPDDEV